MKTEFLLVSTSEQITTISLNRPEKRNAMHGPMILELLHLLEHLAEDNKTRIVVINGMGNDFCAGGDIAWMQKIALGTDDENYDDAQALADLLYQLYTFPKPTLVLAHGATLGGGLGLLAAADIGIATTDASFGFPEVKMGIAPAIISPYLLSVIGARAAQYYFLTAARFNAEEACRLGLIHQVTDKEKLMVAGKNIAINIMENSPNALREAKRLIRHANNVKIDERLIQETAELLAELRRTSEGQEGLKAFIEKRKPNWSIS